MKVNVMLFACLGPLGRQVPCPRDVGLSDDIYKMRWCYELL